MELFLVYFVKHGEHGNQNAIDLGTSITK